jgi:hypothetical protein
VLGELSISDSPDVDATHDNPFSRGWEAEDRVRERSQVRESTDEGAPDCVPIASASSQMTWASGNATSQSVKNPTAESGPGESETNGLWLMESAVSRPCNAWASCRFRHSANPFARSVSSKCRLVIVTTTVEEEASLMAPQVTAVGCQRAWSSSNARGVRGGTTQPPATERLCPSHGRVSRCPLRATFNEGNWRVVTSAPEGGRSSTRGRPGRGCGNSARPTGRP